MNDVAAIEQKTQLATTWHGFHGGRDDVLHESTNKQ